jgi:hypothetical protein
LLAPHDIHDDFHKVRAGVDHRSLMDPAPFGDGSLDNPMAKRRLDEIAELLDTHPRFSERFDYSWAADPASYNDSLELSLQSVLIAALADSNQDHPHLERLRPTAVRSVMNSQFSSTCLSAERVDFICVSFGFIKFMQICVGSMIDFHDIGRSIDGDTRMADTNYLFGQDAERALRTAPEAGREICRRVVDAGFTIAGGGYVAHHSPITGRLASDIGQASLMVPLMLVACEGFVVCHELAHLLGGHRRGVFRALDHEVDADEAATSLLIVASATLRGLPAGTMFGPPAFFQVARLYEMTRRVRAMMHEPGDVSKFIASEHELKLRMKLTGRYIAREIKLPGKRAVFWDVVNELGVLIRGCQLYMLEVFTKEKRDFDFDDAELSG